MHTPGLITAVFALSLTVSAHAEGPAAPSAAASAPVVGSPVPPPREHLVSNEISATVADGLPKYQRTTPAADPASNGELPDLRDTDKPKNTIIRLPKFTVTKPKEPRPPVFTERQMYSQKGLAELALKRHPGLKFGNLFGLNEGIALMMFEEQERLDNLADMATAVENARNSGDPAGASALALERTRVAYRASDIGGAAHAPGQ